MGFTLPLLLLPAVAFCSFWYLRPRKFNKNRVRPPGSKPIPSLRNALQIPIERPWATYAEWGKKWGKFNAYFLLDLLKHSFPDRRCRLR
jgi:hypothetical protein